jgi:hypothetical protein
MKLQLAVLGVVVLAGAALADRGRDVAGASVVGQGPDVRSPASFTCSRATASRVATRLHVGVDPILHRAPIFQVLCGPFFGPRSRGMVASFAVPTGCGGSTGWAVFRYTGKWRVVMQQRNGAFLSKVGSDIQERRGDPRRGDPRCAPSAWKTRLWHWNGHSFTASAWKVTQAMQNFLSPDRKVWCSIDASVAHEMFCTTKADPQHSGTLKRNGDVSICDAAPGDICTQNWNERGLILRYGQVDELGGFRCLSASQGISCTVISGEGKGRGFLINVSGVTKAG